MKASVARAGKMEYDYLCERRIVVLDRFDPEDHASCFQNIQTLSFASTTNVMNLLLF